MPEIRDPSHHRSADTPFGPVRISHDGWPSRVVMVEGPGMPTVTATPDREACTLVVAGQPAQVTRAGRRSDPRRSARTIRVVAGDRAYELKPKGIRRSRLSRNGQVIADARGTLRTYFFWRIPGMDAQLAWRSGADPVDVAIGQAMVTGFGAGAPGALLVMLNAVIGLITSAPS